MTVFGTPNPDYAAERFEEFYEALNDDMAAAGEQADRLADHAPAAMGAIAEHEAAAFESVRAALCETFAHAAPVARTRPACGEDPVFLTAGLSGPAAALPSSPEAAAGRHLSREDGGRAL